MLFLHFFFDHVVIFLKFLATGVINLLLGFRPETNGQCAYLKHQSKTGPRFSLHPPVPTCYRALPGLLPLPYPKVLQLRGQAAFPAASFPYIIQTFLVTPLLFGYPGGCSWFPFPFSSHTAQGHVHFGLSHVSLPLALLSPFYLK